MGWALKKTEKIPNIMKLMFKQRREPINGSAISNGTRWLQVGASAMKGHNCVI